MKIKSLIENLVVFAYRKIFREEMSEDVKAFLKNLVIVGIGSIISALFSAVFIILGGRILGPEEYGKYSSIQSIAMFLAIPMVAGLGTSMVKYTSEIQDIKRQSQIIITSYLITLTLTTFTIVILIPFSYILSDLLNIPPDYFHFSIIFAALYVVYTQTTSALRAINSMRIYSILQVIYGVLMLISLFTLIFIHETSFKAMTYTMYVTYFMIGLASLIILIKKFYKWNLDVTLVKTLGRYALLTLIGDLAFVAYTNVDRIMLSKFKSFSDVGIFGAYYAGSIYISALIFQILILVFFPTISKYKDKSPIFKKINKFIPYLIIGGMVLLVLSELIILKFFGSEYQINFQWIILFAITGVCLFIQGTYAVLFNSIGASGAKIASFTAVTGAIVNVGLNLLLIPNFGISGAIISLMSSYIACIIFVLYFSKKYFTSSPISESN